MPKPKSKKAKGLSPQEIQKMNRDNINHQMEVMPVLQFDDIHGNSNQMMGGLMGNVVPLMQGMIDMGNAQMGANPMMGAFGGQQAPQTPNLMDILGQMQPAQPAQPVAAPAPQDDGWGGVKNDFDAINWAAKRGDISPEEAQWLMRWQQNDANGNTNFVDGGKGTRNWDYMSSDLSSQNKGIVDKFYKSVSGNWGEPAGGQAPVQQSATPQAPVQQPATPQVPSKLPGRRRGGMF